VAASYGVSYATLTAWKLVGSCWERAHGPWTARIGYAGVSTDKHEGDGATPAGVFDFLTTMYGNAPNPGVHYTYHRLVCGDWWDEDSASPAYHTFQAVPCSETHPPFDNGASEPLWTENAAYPSFAVVNYNAARVPGKGSAILLHFGIADPGTGCVSLSLSELNTILDWMVPSKRPSIVIGTAGTIRAY
jgi:L,D-peptidoglycan transpeptidase YkuD (ErfK/YbiS/YcfS/YnhG family)